MKLLLCRACQDVFKLQERTRTCKCKKTKGRYLDEVKAEYSGEHAMPIGFDNESLRDAVFDQPTDGLGRRFTAFVIAKKCDSFVKL